MKGTEGLRALVSVPSPPDVTPVRVVDRKRIEKWWGGKTPVGLLRERYYFKSSSTPVGMWRGTWDSGRLFQRTGNLEAEVELTLLL